MTLPASTDWSGTCGFRLRPTDTFSSGPSAARLTPVAGGAALALDYTWVHPEQGEQAGHLVLGRPDDAGRVTAAWTDAFHQAPEVRVLEGAVPAPAAGTSSAHPIEGEGVALSMDWPGGGWMVAVRLQGGTLAMVMQNEIPEGVPGVTPGAYDVMRAAWRRAGA